ncbi:O-linked N-acetylglucosamine transferase, SPINDLY family protein [Govanella unica]|uniref:protein O-GlcNAc transferase n=1 Tax=Govanella unica TaxID=2975056 RepID=A0A9X3TVK5_9PROT|nr:tetratricopeptide repeat protein [Govania unica]MDA5192524.1 tetratricopeptide repeat protein [Govania unica]
MDALTENPTRVTGDQLQDEALAAFAAGDPVIARQMLAAALRLAPKDYNLQYLQSIMLGACGEPRLAEVAFETATQAQIDDHLERLLGDGYAAFQETAAKLRELGMALYQKNQMSLAGDCFRQSIRKDPGNFEAWKMLGLALQHQGRSDEAVNVFRTALQFWSSNAMLHSMLHYALCFGPRDHHELMIEGQRWNAAHAAARMPRPLQHGNDRNPDRRLKIGYFSSIFSQHQLSYFLEPVFSNHDRAAFEIYCYVSNDAPEDPTQQRIQSMVDHWRPVATLNDAAMAQQIRDDGIDVLVDLWGHTIGNRLSAFAFKPAPVQVEWLNYGVTTGLEAMDYIFLADNWYVPGDEALFSEEIYTIGDIAAPFRTSTVIRNPGKTPALDKGHVTFGSYNHPGKITDRVVELWARILKGVPNSKLMLRYRYFEDLVTQKRFEMRFFAHGIEAGRLVFAPHVSGAEYWTSFRDIDLALDSFPYQGYTTTFDALTAGVPLLSYEGDFHRERPTPTVLRNCGLDSLVATCHDDYVARAIALGSNPGELNRLRKIVGPALQGSSTADGAGFTLKLEAAYRDVFRRWCESAG